MRPVPKFQCRNDMVLVLIVQEPKTLIAYPQQSAEGKQHVVIAAGPDVKDLKVGDRVMTLGGSGDTFVMLPGRKDLYVTRQSNIALTQEDGWLIAPLESGKEITPAELEGQLQK